MSTAKRTAAAAAAAGGRPRRLALLCLLLSATVCRAQQSCPLTMHIYSDSSDCEAGRTPDTVGTINANGQCNAARTLSGSADQLPGNYRATCVASDHVSIYQSGCTQSDCSSSSSGGSGTCDRNFDVPSLYARLSPPEYLVQSTSTSSFRCFQLSSNDDSMSVTFYITGDCSQCSGGGGGDDDGSGATAAPTQDGGISPGTYAPVAPTTPSPVTSAPTHGQPVTDTPAPSYATAPAATPLNDDAFQDDDLSFGGPSPSPSSDLISPGFSSPPSGTGHSAPASTGLIVGAALGVVAALVGFLLAGFILGKRLHDRHTKGDPASGGGSDKDFERSLAGRVAARPPHGTSQGTPDTSFLTPADCFIHLDRRDDGDDGVSMLEDPTIFTRDNTVTKMMREAEDQETLAGLETTDYSLQVEDHTVDRTVWSRTSC